METVTRIRKIYTPLSLASVIKTSETALAQLYNQFEGTTTPLRSQSSPSVLTPDIQAVTNTDDPTWTDGNKNAILQEVRWLANGVDIEVSGTDIYKAFHTPQDEPLYSIDKSDTSTKGTLSLWLNPTPEQRFTLQFSAKLYDSRTGLTYPILTDGVDVYVNTLGDSEWDFSLVHDVNIRYSPCYDRLRLYDYLTSIGKVPATDTERKKYTDGMGYDLNMKFIVTHGHETITDPGSNIRFRIEDHLDHHAELTTQNTPWLRELDNRHIRIDQRYIDGERTVFDIRMEVLIDGTWTFQSQEQVTVTRWFPSVAVTPTNTCDLDLTAQTRTDHALVLFNGVKVDYPLAYLDLQWYARSSDNDPWTPQGSGEDVTINQAALGIGVGQRTDLQIKLEYKFTLGYSYLVNAKGEYITNEDGAMIVVMF